MTPKEKELLNGMVNCYNTCHANFEETLEMVGSARGLTPGEVKAILDRIREEDGEDYKALRQRLPGNFPL